MSNEWIIYSFIYTNFCLSTDDTLPAPRMHCQDEGFVVLVWNTEKGTSYFLEYSISTEDRNFTDLVSITLKEQTWQILLPINCFQTTDSFYILKDLQPNTQYWIQLTSVYVDQFSVYLQRSSIIFIRTLRTGRTPLPVQRVYLDSFKLIDDTYTAFVKWERAPGKS